MFAIRVTFLFLMNIFLIEFGTNPVFCFTRQEFLLFEWNCPDFKPMSIDDQKKLCEKAVSNETLFKDIVTKPLTYKEGYPRTFDQTLVHFDDKDRVQSMVYFTSLHCAANDKELVFGCGQGKNDLYYFECAAGFDDAGVAKGCSGKFNVPDVFPL